MESGARTLGLVLVRDVEKEDSPENLHPVGVAGKILEAIQEEEGNAHILISCLERFSIRKLKKHPRDSSQGWNITMPLSSPRTRN